MVAIKISRNPTGQISNASNFKRSSLTPTQISQQIHSDSVIIQFDEPKLKICTPIPFNEEAITADIAHPSPTPLDFPDSNKKPNPDNPVLGQFGTQELNIFVFVAFTFMIGCFMGAGKVISTGTYGFEENIGFTILYAIG